MLLSRSSKVTFIGTVLLLAGLAGEAAVPQGWRLSGSNPQAYEGGVEQVSARIKVPGESASDSGLPTAYLRSKRPVANGFGTLMQSFTARKYAGHRVQFTAFVKTVGVQDWAGLWVRIDGKEASRLANMQDRPIQGTTDWRHYGITLDVPPNATRIAIGVWLAGSGAVWMNRLRFEALGLESQEAGPRGDGPVNLNFRP